MTPLNAEDAYDELVRLKQEEALLSSAAATLQWDAEIVMPKAGIEHRSKQMSMLAGLVHERATNPKYGELLAVIESSGANADPHSSEAVNVRELRRDYDRQNRLPRKLVEEMARVTAIASQVWAEARDKDDFAAFAPWLEKHFALAREKADALGFEADRYDALLEDYEPGMTAEELTGLFEQLRSGLVPLVGAIRGLQSDETSLSGAEFPLERQREFSEGIAVELGFDLDCGRFDLGPHPFCTTIGPRDVRIALRYQRENLASGFFAVLHETGHAFYEQGLDASQYGLPMGEATSLGIHESQSRLWENFVGRSEGFWRRYYPRLQKQFPDALDGVTLDRFRRSVNTVVPGLIRVQADEVTYNLHVIIRFELERALLSGDLPTADLPGAWSELYSRYLGVKPEDDRSGCLQDIHWSEGLIGYFPTYSLGNVFAAQLFVAAERAIGPLEEAFEEGEFGTLRSWLRENIHGHGRRYRSAELIRAATGSSPDPSALIDSLSSRYGANHA